MKTILSKDRAKEICSNWHGGQWSSLYQFASSGVYLVENHLKYLKETQECREPEYYLHPGTISKKDDKELKKLIAFFEYKGQENGITTEWHKHSDYGYMIPYITQENEKVIKLALLV